MCILQQGGPPCPPVLGAGLLLPLWLLGGCTGLCIMIICSTGRFCFMHFSLFFYALLYMIVCYTISAQEFCVLL